MNFLIFNNSIQHSIETSLLFIKTAHDHYNFPNWKCDQYRWHLYGRKSIKGITKDCVSVSGAGTNSSLR